MFFDERVYFFAYLFVISRRVVIDSLEPISKDTAELAAQARFREHISREARAHFASTILALVVPTAVRAYR